MSLETITRREFLKKAGEYSRWGALTTLTASLTGCKACDEDDNDDGTPISDNYNISVNCYDMTSLQGDNFVTNLKVSDARVDQNGTLLPVGTSYFEHKGHYINIDFTGSVHDDVLVVKKAGSDKILKQSQNGPARINLASLGQGNSIHLELYKIPKWVDINKLKEALTKGTAVYQKPVTVWLDNEGYSNVEWNRDKPAVVSKINHCLNEINPCMLGTSATLSSIASSGELECRFSPDYSNAGHGESGSGVMSQSEIQIRTDESIDIFLAELYGALGVRHDIGLDNSIRDDISDDGRTLNKHGKAYMKINYFLDPNTKL